MDSSADGLRRRVVVTGLGCITAAGPDVARPWAVQWGEFAVTHEERLRAAASRVLTLTEGRLA